MGMTRNDGKKAYLPLDLGVTPSSLTTFIVEPFSYVKAILLLSGT